MRIREHVVLTIVMVALWLGRDELINLLAFSIGSILIDIDHPLDFFIIYHRPTFSITELSKLLEGRKNVFLPFHSMEVILSVLLYAVCTTNHFLGFMAVGMMFHFTVDIITNGYPTFLSIFLTYRLTKWRDMFRFKTQ